MRCPRCRNDGFGPYTTCTRCGFSGAPGRIEELSHIAYLLDELQGWPEVGEPVRGLLRSRYLRRHQQLEIELGLRRPTLTPAAIRELHWEVLCLTELQAKADDWVEQGWVREDLAGRLRQGAKKRAEALRERLKDAPPAPAFGDPRDHLNLLRYLERMLQQAYRRGYFLDDRARDSALAHIRAERREVEIQAGLRRPPRLSARPTTAGRQDRGATQPPRPPREALTWDRIWQTMLSERTLNVLLFLGAFLLVASATTYVLYNWENLPVAAQLAFIILFTLSFYGAGWFLRVRMDLRASGIAVTTVGSLLLPLDFYAIFVAGGVVPPAHWQWVWLAASVVCLPIYISATLRIQSEFFGYLVAVAAGNLLCAALRVIGVPPEWFMAGLVALALALVALAYRLAQTKWAVLCRPVRFSALIGTPVILSLGIGLATLGRVNSSDMDASLAAAWTLGATLFAFAAAREQSPLLGRAAATVLPVALSLVLRLIFDPLSIKVQWHAVGWAILAAGYLWAGYRWSSREAAGIAQQREAEMHRAWGRTATGWGLALMVSAAIWSPFNLWAAAATYATLTVASCLAIYLWQKPRALPAASLLAFSAMTFAMAAGHLEPAELCLGWALLAVLHVLAALYLRRAPEHAARLFAAALVTALLAILPPAIVRHESLLTYGLGQWIALAGWMLWLDRDGRHPGLGRFLRRFGPLRSSALHWAIALPVPFFAAMLYTRFRAPDAWLGFLLAVLAWGGLAVGHWASRKPAHQGAVARRSTFPWYVMSYGCSVAAPFVTLSLQDQVLLGVTVLLAAGLYLISAWTWRHSLWLLPGGLALPLGLLILLDYWVVPWPPQSVVLAAITAAYLIGGTWLERHRGIGPDFMAPLDGVAHLVAAVALFWGLEPAAQHLIGGVPWLDSARLWGAGGQLVLAITYALFAWFHNQRRWAHAAAWLGVLAGGLVASAYSQGHGSSALKTALLATAYVLAERGLASQWVHRRWSGATRAWRLYRQALLIAGWCVSAGAIGLALLRNLLLLGGGPVREAWAIADLLTITVLYALAAWMYRRPIFVWLAGIVAVVPWTLLTSWGWFLWPAPPSLPRYALAWAILACLELGLGLTLTLRTRHAESRLSGSATPEYGLPLRVIANGLLPFALFWAVADPATSSITWGVGLAFYAASSVADRRCGLSGWRAARFLYPAAAVGPVWAIHLLRHFAPAAPPETHGVLLLALALPLLAAGRRLQRFDPAAGLPPYLAAYGVAIAGTLLAGHQEPLLAAALVYDSLLCVLSAWRFREPLWGYPAAALAPAALLVALDWRAIPLERRGWWLIGLGVVYLALAWALYRARHRDYATAPLVAAFAVVALGLPPSSLDDLGAFWGYLAAAIVYAAAAGWLRKPLLLTPAAALLAVPYGVAVANLGLDRASYGLAIFPGVAAALALAHLLDRLLPIRRATVLASSRRAWIADLRNWWAAPFYAWGYAGALLAAGLSFRADSGLAWAHSLRLAIALALAALTFLHATWRFRSRACLLLAGALAQGAALAAIDSGGWLRHPSWAALAFLPVTAATAAVALAVELSQEEGSPLSTRWSSGWSRPLYLLLAIDLLGGQGAALAHSEPGAVVTVAHALLLSLLATIWIEPLLPFAAVGVGIAGFFQAMAWAGAAQTGYPLGLALLALGFGLLGYGLVLAWGRQRRIQLWARPLEWTAWGLSAAAFLWAAASAPDVTGLVIRTFLGRTLTFAEYAPQVRMVMWVFALTGLLYLATAVMRRRYALGYVAVALLLGGWALWWRFFLDMPEFQWYAVPAGLYLLAIGWLEWRRGRRSLARWIDRTGMLAWLGTAWWQSLPGVMPSGWSYALLLGGEALLLVWWGSARRMKQFLYVGTIALVLNTVTQAIEPLLSANRWIVFGIAGALLVGLATLVERKLEAIRTMSAEMRVRLEGWE